MPPSFALAESACRSASARTFFGRSIAWLRADRAERTAAAAEQLARARAVTGAAGALLLVHLLAGAPDLGAVLDLVRAGAALGELPDDAALDEVGARLEAEDVLVRA